VTAAVLTVTADPQTKTYGAANPSLTVRYSGFVNGDTAAGLTTPATVSTSATTASAVGTYRITASGRGERERNYTISYVDGTLTVTAAELTVTAESKSRGYGDATPALTASYSGFKNGRRWRRAVSPVAESDDHGHQRERGRSYPITVAAGTLTSANYTFTFVNGATVGDGGDADGDGRPPDEGVWRGEIRR